MDPRRIQPSLITHEVGTYIFENGVDALEYLVLLGLWLLLGKKGGGGSRLGRSAKAVRTGRGISFEGVTVQLNGLGGLWVVWSTFSLHADGETLVEATRTAHTTDS